MKVYAVVILFLGLTGVCFSQSKEIVRQVELRDPTALSTSMSRYEVVQEFDAQGLPSGYHMDLLTDVCDDKLCKLLNVTLHWDALGRFERLEIPADAPLTKLDHLEFSPDDYQKLDDILRDDYSVLSRYSMKDINGGSKPGELDAISGATPLEVQDSVVQGAAYTTWVLWRWVHGEITEELLQMTSDSSSPEFITHCLQSRDQKQIEYALECTGRDTQFWEPVRGALEHMDYGNLVHAVHYLGQVDEVRLAKLVGRIPQQASEQVVKYFSKQATALNPEVLNTLASRLPHMGYYELYTSLTLFDVSGFASETIHGNMLRLTNSPNPFIARRAKEYLQTTGP